MRLFIPFALSLALIFGLASCATTSVEEIEVCVQDSTSVTYVDDIVPIMVTYCTPDFNEPADRACHGSGSPLGDWTDYTSTKLVAEGGLFDARVVQPGGGMPPSYSTGPQSLGRCDTEVITAWIAAGAPEN